MTNKEIYDKYGKDPKLLTQMGQALLKFSDEMGTQAIEYLKAAQEITEPKNFRKFPCNVHLEDIQSKVKDGSLTSP